MALNLSTTDLFSRYFQTFYMQFKVCNPCKLGKIMNMSSKRSGKSSGSRTFELALCCIFSLQFLNIFHITNYSEAHQMCYIKMASIQSWLEFSKGGPFSMQPIKYLFTSIRLVHYFYFSDSITFRGMSVSSLLGFSAIQIIVS